MRHEHSHQTSPRQSLRGMFQNHKWSFLALGSALLMAPIVAQGGDGSVVVDEERAAHIFERMSSRFDADQDGVISADEVGSEKRFAHMDRNGDAQITAEDFVGMEPRRHRRGGERGGGLKLMLGHLAQSADTDQDGKVSRAEHAAAIAAIDLDGDGFLSAEEMEAKRQAVRTELGVDATRGAEPRGPRHEMRMRFLDKDGDDKIAVSEVQGTFDRFDRNEDGFLTEADRPQRRERMRRGARSGFFLHLADADDDRILTQAEWSAFLAAVDENSDGTLSRDELESLRPDDAPQPRFSRSGPAGDGIEVARLNELFTKLDADADGDIEGDEWKRGRRGPRGERERGPRRGSF